jgi:hypothetical protein
MNKVMPEPLEKDTHNSLDLLGVSQILQQLLVESIAAYRLHQIVVINFSITRIFFFICVAWYI